MNRRKKTGNSPRSASHHSPQTKRRRFNDSPSPIRRKPSTSEMVRPPPEFPSFDYEKKCPTLKKLTDSPPEDQIIEDEELVSLQHEIEAMLTECAMNTRRAKGELQFLNDGEFPKEDLRKRLMPKFELRQIEEEEEEASTSPTAILEKEGICGLPEDYDEDDMNQFPVYDIPLRFWTWCKADFLKDVDADYLKTFKEGLVDKYSNEALQKFFVNEPWKYRKRTVPTRSNRASNSGLNSSSKTPKKVSISNDVECNWSGSGKRKMSSSRISSRRSSEKDSANNNKIMPMIGSMVISARREFIDGKETPLVARRSRTRRDESRERRLSISVKNESDADYESINGTECNGVEKASPKSPLLKMVKKEKDELEDEEECESPEIERKTNGSNGTNGHSNGYNCNGKTNGEASPKSPKPKNGELKNGTLNGHHKPVNDRYGDLEDFDAKAIGSRIVSKLIAGGILPESSSHIYEQMAKEDIDCAGTSKLEISEEGKEEADDPAMDELSEELRRCQLELQEIQPQLNALVALSWRRAKAQYAFLYSFEQMKKADYSLFKLGVNMYKDFPRKLPSLMEQPILKDALKRRNRQARFHYAITYRRHPKFRWRLKPLDRSPSAS